MPIDTMATYAIVAALICTLVSIVELLNRYTHSVHLDVVIWNVPAIVYLTLNFVVGVVTVYVASITEIVEFEAQTGVTSLGIVKACGIGFAGLAVLRSSLATLSIGGNDVSIGPSALLDSLRDYLDGKIDQYQKKKIAPRIAKLMSAIDHEIAKNDLPALCVAGLKRCTKTEVDSLMASIGDIGNMQIKLATKNCLIGQAIYLLCGIDVLESSVLQLSQSSTAASPSVVNEQNESNAIAEDLANELQRLKGKL